MTLVRTHWRDLGPPEACKPGAVLYRWTARLHNPPACRPLPTAPPLGMRSGARRGGGLAVRRLRRARRHSDERASAGCLPSSPAAATTLTRRPRSATSDLDASREIAQVAEKSVGVCAAHTRRAAAARRRPRIQQAGTLAPKDGVRCTVGGARARSAGGRRHHLGQLGETVQRDATGAPAPCGQRAAGGNSDTMIQSARRAQGYAASSWPRRMRAAAPSLATPTRAVHVGSCVNCALGLWDTTSRLQAYA